MEPYIMRLVIGVVHAQEPLITIIIGRIVHRPLRQLARKDDPVPVGRRPAPKGQCLSRSGGPK